MTRKRKSLPAAPEMTSDQRASPLGGKAAVPVLKPQRKLRFFLTFF